MSVLLNKTFVIGLSSAVIILIVTIILVLVILKRRTALNRQDNQQGHKLISYAHLNDKFIMLYSENDPHFNNRMHYHIVNFDDSFYVAL